MLCGGNSTAGSNPALSAPISWGRHSFLPRAHVGQTFLSVAGPRQTRMSAPRVRGARLRSHFVIPPPMSRGTNGDNFEQVSPERSGVAEVARLPAGSDAGSLATSATGDIRGRGDIRGHRDSFANRCAPLSLHVPRIADDDR